MNFAKAGCPAFLFVVGGVACAAERLFWSVEVIMVGFSIVRKFHKLWPMAQQDGYLPRIPQFRLDGKEVSHIWGVQLSYNLKL